MPVTKTLYIKTWGCQMNVYDSDRMADVLAPLGYRPVDAPEGADMVILNTCHIREKATEKVFCDLGRIRDHQKAAATDGKRMIVAVAGCVAQAEGAEIAARAPYVDMVFGPQTYHRLPEMVARAMRAAGETVLDTEFPPESKFDALPEEASPRGAAAFLSVQEGCDKFCSFCVVPYTRGAEFSRPVAQVLAEARRLVEAGALEITLLGQNVNAYHGEGPHGGEWGLGRLIRALAEAHPDLPRIRYTTSHPRDMDDDLIAAHGEIPALMPFLHLPVQSGSDKVLAAMNRKHTGDEYRRLIERLRTARPDLALSSDFIVGHPGESDADFAETLLLVEDIGFSQAYSFKYSPRPGTPAAIQAAQIPEIVKTERLAALQDLLYRQQRRFNKAAINTRLPVLFDRHGKHPGQLLGRSPYMQAVHADLPNAMFGKIAALTITAASGTSLSGDDGGEGFIRSLVFRLGVFVMGNVMNGHDNADASKSERARFKLVGLPHLRKYYDVVVRYLEEIGLSAEVDVKTSAGSITLDFDPNDQVALKWGLIAIRVAEQAQEALARSGQSRKVKNYQLSNIRTGVKSLLDRYQFADGSIEKITGASDFMEIPLESLIIDVPPPPKPVAPSKQDHVSQGVRNDAIIEAFSTRNADDYSILNISLNDSTRRCLPINLIKILNDTYEAGIILSGNNITIYCNPAHVKYMYCIFNNIKLKADSIIGHITTKEFHGIIADVTKNLDKKTKQPVKRSVMPINVEQPPENPSFNPGVSATAQAAQPAPKKTEPFALVTRKGPVEALTEGQDDYIKAMKASEMVMAVGAAGTGKTYLAVLTAVAMLRAGYIERIILSRPAVEAGERLGFLPGDLKEKIDPYLRPLYDALNEAMPSDQVNRKISTGEIEIAPLAFMRGRTLANAFVILDEAQNTTEAQMKMFLTRMGKDTRMVITGDLSQIDLPPGIKSGLKDLLDLHDDDPELRAAVPVIRFGSVDVQRHPLVGKFVSAYEKRDRIARGEEFAVAVNDVTKTLIPQLASDQTAADLPAFITQARRPSTTPRPNGQ